MSCGILLLVVLGVFGFLGSTWSQATRAEATIGVLSPAAPDVITATLRFDQNLYPVSLGSTFTASLLVDDASSLGGWEAVFVYDPASIEVVQVASGGFLGSSGRTVEGLERDEGPGHLALGAYSYGASPAVTGSGVLVYLTLRALAAGSSTLTLENALLAAIDGSGVVQSQPVTVQGATVTANPPLAVSLAAFDAQAFPGHILVTWETVSEASNAGFNLSRSLSADDKRTLLEHVPSAAPGATQGAAYSYEDSDVAAGQGYWYWLEDVNLAGAATLHGPVSVVFQAPTVVTLERLAAETTAPSPALPGASVLAALLTAGAGLAVQRRRAGA